MYTAQMWKEGNRCRNLVGTLITCKPRNEVIGNSHVNLREIHFEGEKWMYVAQGCVEPVSSETVY